MQSGHQSVARTGAEPRRDVQPRRDTVEHDPRDHHRDPSGEAVHLGDEGERAVHGEADGEDVGDRPEAGALPHRDPQQQDRRADDDRDDSDGEPGALGEALVQHPPGFEAEPGADEKRRAHSVQGQTDVQLNQPPREMRPARDGGVGQDVLPGVVAVDRRMTLCGGVLATNYGQSEEGGLIFMAQWTSAVGAAQLARQLQAQQQKPMGPGTRRPPAYRALADGIRLLVLEGRVPVAARLPAERELALAPVRQPYHRRRRLRGAARPRGSWSPAAAPGAGPRYRRAIHCPPAVSSRCRPESLGSMIDLGCASLPAPEPWLTRAVQGALEELPPYAHTHGDYPAGLPALRQMIADRYTERGIATMPEQIMVTTGAMGAIDAICHLFAGRGERIAVESPSYANILQLMREAGARLVPVAMEEGLGGWDMNRWRQVLRDAAPRLAYVVADFHNPTGALADEDQRRGTGGRGPLRRDRPGRRRDHERAPPGRRRRDAAPGLRLRPGGQHRAHRRLGQQGLLGRHADRLGARRAGRDPQSGVRPRLRRPGHPRAGAARDQLADAHRGLGGGGRRSAAARHGRTGTRWSRRCAGNCRSGSSRCRAAG